MSEKSKIRHAQREAQQEKQAKKVVAWIFAALIVLAVVFLVIASMSEVGMSGLEIERKFLVHKAGEPYKGQAYASSRITQGYICGERGRTVRVRIRDGRGFLTIKGESDPEGTTRYEFEKEITLDEAQHLMKLCLPGLIDKTRYLVRCGTHTFEVDEFYGENDGLVVAEVELQSADEPFDKPEFIADEVTGDRRFYNSQLMKTPFSAWRDTLPPEFR